MRGAKSGRSISAKNRARIETAIDHLETAIKCYREILESDAAAEAEAQDEAKRAEAERSWLPTTLLH